MAIILVEQLNSTNAYAKLNIDLLADRDIVICNVQTEGRGRMQRAWNFVGDDNVYMSFVLKPSDEFKDVYSNITQYLSVILADIIDEMGVDAQIKWPNDVLINGKKVAGILAETVMQGSNFKGLVVGVGINLNCSEEDIAKINKPSTSLNFETHKNINKKEFVHVLVDKFFSRYEMFLDNGFKFVKNDYIKHATFLNKEIEMCVFNKMKKGFAKGLTDNGALILQDENGIEEVVTIGDIL